MVQRELFARGYTWSGGHQDIDERAHGVGNGAILANEDRRIGYSDFTWYATHAKWGKLPTFDAATQMGALLEYLDAPEKPKLTVGCRGRKEPVTVVEGGSILIGELERLILAIAPDELDAIHAASLEARKK